MEYRVLGRTGVKISPICLGTDAFANPTPEKEAAQIINRALDVGINLLDTGDSYADGESERIIGRVLKERGGRQSVLISTKCHPGPLGEAVAAEKFGAGRSPNMYGPTRLNLIRACEASLRRLQTDYLDLYQVHRYAPHIPIDETLGALTDLVRQGKVRYIGCSTHPAWAVVEAIKTSEAKGYVSYISEQPPYNLLDRRIENELLPMARAYGLGILAWAPMAMGVLAGRYTEAGRYPEGSRAALRGGFYAQRVSARGVEVGKKFVRLAEENGILPQQLAVLWCKDQPGVTAPLIGPRTVVHLKEMLPVLDMTLADSLRAACDELVPPGSAVADFHNTSGWHRGAMTL